MRIATALMLACLVGATGHATQASEPFLAIAGAAHVHVPPDHAEFSAEVVTRVDSLEAATQKHTPRAGKAAEVLRGLAKYGVSVERSAFRLEQLRPGLPQKAKMAPTEYRAITGFALRFSRIDALNDAVSAIAAAGLFEVRSIRYGVQDEERVLDEARRAAVKNARRQAEVFADAAGVQLGDILEMTDGTAGGLGSEAALRMPAPNVQLTPPATIPFRAAITIKWRIKPR